VNDTDRALRKMHKKLGHVPRITPWHRLCFAAFMADVRGDATRARVAMERIVSDLRGLDAVVVDAHGAMAQSA
jgi:hypothetical protein